MLDRFILDLKAAGQSSTRPRQRIFAYLQTAGPSTPAKIIRAFDGELDRASVYRTLALFDRLGMVQEVGSGQKRAYELSDRYDVHHHHFRCVECGQTEAMHEPGVESSLKRAAKARGWRLDFHQIELSGLCARCVRQEG